MAVIHGESGAWKDARAPLHRVGLYPETPEGVRELHGPLEQAWIESESSAVAAYEETTQRLARHVELSHTEYLAALSRAQAEYDARQTAMNQQLQAGNLAPGVARSILKWFRNIPLSLRKRHMQFQHDRHLTSLDQIPKDAQAAQQRHLASRARFLDEYRLPYRQRLDAVNQVLNSNEYAGAIGELDVLYHLQRLPDDFALFADVRLEYKRYLYYESEHLKTAQIDFVVIGPPGVFLIEVKQWSRAFTDSGTFHDPYKQSDRASYLCYKMLKEAGLQTKVRTIIATQSQLPAKPANSYVKVLASHGVCGYIRYFKPALDAERVAQLMAFMRRWQG